MAQQNITIGVQDAKTGDTLFDAFTKTQANFTDLYSITSDTYTQSVIDLKVADAQNHDLQTNLTNDTHPQYALSDGTRGINNKMLVNSVGHGFTDGQAVYFDGIWNLAQADVLATTGTHYVELIDVDNFYVVGGGHITSSGLTPGDWYYVSEVTPGLLVTTIPATGFNNPICQALSTTILNVVSYRAMPV